MNNFYVYLLIDPRNNLPFYVGKGSGNRSNHHLLEKDNSNKLKFNKVSKIKKLGMKVIVEKIKENLKEKEAFQLEIEIVKKYGRLDKKTGILCNLTDGGEGPTGRIVTEKTKNLLREKRKNQILSEEHLNALKNSRLGKKDSLETCLKKSQSRIGMKHSEETKLKISIKKKEHDAEFGSIWLGRHHTEETKRKLEQKLSRGNSKLAKPCKVDGIFFSCIRDAREYFKENRIKLKTKHEFEYVK